MNFKATMAVVILSFSSFATSHAAGGPVHEDFSALRSLSQKMIFLSKKQDVDGFVTIAREAIRQAAENYNNSMSLTQISSKIRAAKKAVRIGKFSDAITYVEDAQRVMQKEKVLTWDGGSE